MTLSRADMRRVTGRSGVPGFMLHCRRIGAVLVCVVLGGCAAGRDLRHTVHPGDTLYEIGRRYGASHHEIARVNGIRDPRRLRPGQVLRIPGRKFRATAAIAPAPMAAAPVQTEARAEPAPFLWPVAGGTMSSPFGPRDEGFHDGIDISAPTGTPVRAAQRGVVAYSGYRRGYGNVVVVQHAPGLSTLYGHNQTNWVRVGQAVRRGEVIASLGDTGRTTGPNLHFEVWIGSRLVDPLHYVARPDARVADAADVRD